MSILENIRSKGRNFVHILLNDEISCRTYIKILPPPCQHIFLRLLSIGKIRKSSLVKMFKSNGEKHVWCLIESFLVDSFVEVIDDEEVTFVEVNPYIKNVFLNNTQNANTFNGVSVVENPFLSDVDSSIFKNEKHDTVTTKESFRVISDFSNGKSEILDTYSQQCLNKVLFCLLELMDDNPVEDVDYANIKELLKKSSIIDNFDDRPTGLAKEFLLSSNKKQIWTLIDTLLNSNSTDIDSYRFIIKLGGLHYSHGYPTHTLSAVQKECLDKTLSEIGLVYVEDGFYYPTKSVLNFFGKSNLFDTEGWLFIDTNYKISAFPKNIIQGRLLKLFTKVSYEIPGYFLSCYISPGTLFGRHDKVKTERLIPVETIIEFIETNYSQKHGDGKIPDNIFKQLMVWKKQRNRFTVYPPGCIREFLDSDFADAARDLAEELGCLQLFSDVKGKNVILVTDKSGESEFQQRLNKLYKERYE